MFNHSTEKIIYQNKKPVKHLSFIILFIVFSYELLYCQIVKVDSRILQKEKDSVRFVQNRKPLLFSFHTVSHSQNQEKHFPWASYNLSKQYQDISFFPDSLHPVPGPYGGTVRSIALDPSNNWLFIATDGEVYRSKDNGLHWNMNLFPSQLHNSVEPVTILGPKVIVAETDYNNFISRDGGESWHYLNEDVQGFTVDKSGIIYAGSNYRGVKISTDTAKTWKTFALQGKKIWKVVLCEKGKFACPSDSGIFYSQDNGGSWIFRPYDTRFTWNLVSDKKGHLFVLKYFGYDFQLFRSNDFGINWQRIFLPISGNPYRIYVEENGRLLVPAGKYILISTNAGETWEKISFGALTIGRDATGNLLAGNFDGIFRYDKTMDKWYNINNGINARRIETIDFTSSGSILVLSSGTCFRSTDLGNSWSPIKLDSSIFLYSYAPIYSSSQGSIFMAAIFDNKSECGLLRSHDDGVTWERISVISNYYAIKGITEGVSGDILVATFYGDIYRSADTGNSWTKVYSVADHSEITCISADKLGNYYAANDTSVLVSQDGVSWEVTPMKRKKAYFESLSIDSHDEIFFGSSINGIYHSSDYGSTWNLMNDGLLNRFVMCTAADDIGNVVLGTSTGIYRLADSVNSWVSFNKGFPKTFTTSISISPDGYLFAGTQSFGMYKSTRPLGTRIPVNPPSPVPIKVTHFALSQNYPNPFNSTTNIDIKLPYKNRIKLEIYNILGQLVKTVLDKELEAGFYTIPIIFNYLPSGPYVYKISFGNLIKIGKMMYIK